MKHIKLFETYSNDIDEIRDFIDGLPDKVCLYRGLILSEDDDIDKDNLGIHWSLDEYFVMNMFEYDTFKMGNDIEDCRFIVATAIFDKKDIDIDKTIEKRLIKDRGHYWDELTGELITFSDGDRVTHPYQHEDEIVIKPDSKPIEIDFEEVEI